MSNILILINFYQLEVDLKIDNYNCDYAVIEGLKKSNLGLSIMNRLIRACENNII